MTKTTTNRSDCGCGETPSAGGALPPQDLLRHTEEGLRRFKEHLIQPPPEFAAKKASTFDVDRARIQTAVPIFICGLERKIVFHPVKRYEANPYGGDQYVHHVTPESLDHVKELVGVPNEVFTNMQKRGTMSPYVPRRAALHGLPVTDTIHFNRLEGDERIAVHDLASDLLNGYADPEVLKQPPYKAVVDYVIRRVVSLPVFVGKDLVVCPDETVAFDGFGAVYFDNVVVVGTGKIVLGANTKLHAYQIKHL